MFWLLGAVSLFLSVLYGRRARHVAPAGVCTTPCLLLRLNIDQLSMNRLVSRQTLAASGTRSRRLLYNKGRAYRKNPSPNFFLSNSPLFPCLNVIQKCSAWCHSLLFSPPTLLFFILINSMKNTFFKEKKLLSLYNLLERSQTPKTTCTLMHRDKGWANNVTGLIGGNSCVLFTAV